MLEELKVLGDEGKPQGHHSAGGKFTLSVQKIKMSACLVFTILMGYRLSHAAESQNICAGNETLETFNVSAGGNVAVPCPQLTGEHLKFNLLKQQKVIYTHSSHKNNVSKSDSPYTREDVEMHENKDNKSFRLTGVNNSHHGIYRCEGTVMYPPPLVKAYGSRILVLVEGHQGIDCKNCNVPETVQLSVSLWIWIVVGGLIIYSITVTVIAIISLVKLRRTDSQSDYMNTKPRAPRGHNKKRGAGTHIGLPRHF